MDNPSFLTGDKAMAACVLWSSGLFDTASIADILTVREDAVYRTLHDVRDTAAGRKPDRASAGQAAPPEGQPPAGGDPAREATL